MAPIDGQQKRPAVTSRHQNPSDADALNDTDETDYLRAVIREFYR